MNIPQLPPTPNVGPEVENSLWRWLIELGNRIRQVVSWINASQKTEWQTPTLLNNWGNYGGGYSDAGYYKDSLGTVHLRGMVKGGTPTSNIFVLPVGYRPLGGHLTFPVITSPNVIGRCSVLTSGVVIANAGSGDYFSLSGISFRVEA